MSGNPQVSPATPLRHTMSWPNRFQFLLKLALRNALRHWRRSSVVVVLLTVSLIGLLVYQAFYQGLVRQMVNNILSIGIGHLQVYPRDRLESQPMDYLIPNADALAEEIQSVEIPLVVTPRLRTYGLITSPETSEGVEIQGIDAKTFVKVFPILDFVKQGTFEPVDRGVVLGKHLAKKLKVKLGSKVVLMWASGRDLESEALYVKGIVETPYAEINERVIFVDRAILARPTVTPNPATELVIRLDRREDLWRARQLIGNLVQQKDSTLVARTWREIAPWLASYIIIGDYSLYIYYVIILIAVVIGAVSVFFMNIQERTREHGVLLALGLRPKELFGMILLESLVLTLVSILIGNLIADPLILYFNKVGFDLSRFASGLEMMGLQARIHTPLTRLNLFLSNLMILLTGLAAATLPATRVRKLKAVDALRFT